jgi:hypothetical protein
MNVFDGIEIEEACARDALFKEGIVAIPAVVGQEPSSAKWDNARLCRKLAGVMLQSRVKLRWRDKIRGESGL